MKPSYDYMEPNINLCVCLWGGQCKMADQGEKGPKFKGTMGSLRCE